MSRGPNRRCELPLVFVMAVSATFFIANLAGGAVTCSTNNCVEFSQWGKPGSNLCWENTGSELWSFEDACCDPEVDSTWCQTVSYVEYAGASTRKKFSSCVRACTTSSCDDDQVQIFTSDTSIELADGTRYECPVEE